MGGMHEAKLNRAGVEISEQNINLGNDPRKKQ